MADIECDGTVRIYKYPLRFANRVEVEMPAGAEVLCVQVQGEQICLWAKVAANSPQVARAFYIVGTGHPMPVKAGAYVGTVQIHGGSLVFHVFEEVV